VQRFQKRKKTVKSSVSFCTFGIFFCWCSYNVGKIELQEKLDDDPIEDESSNEFGNKSFAMNFSDNFADMKLYNAVDVKIDEDVDIDNFVDTKMDEFQRPDADDDEKRSLESFIRYQCYI